MFLFTRVIVFHLFKMRFIVFAPDNDIIYQAVIRKTKSSHRGAGAL